MWRSISASVTGPSHARTGLPCQDSHAVEVLTRSGEASLVACVADGAGSAAKSQDGSSLACDAIREQATEFFDEHQGSFERLNRGVIADWFAEARARVARLADLREEKIREYATTLAVACVSPGAAVFAQIGDGAIVVRRGGVLGVVFWPQSGEYANTTQFLTGDDLDTHLQIRNCAGGFDDVALLTDGIERLALSFEGQTAHSPFFDPLFGALRQADDPASLTPELRDFLDSDSMKARSDDDKTVVLAAHAAAR